jgi:hypothetical protein
MIILRNSITILLLAFLLSCSETSTGPEPSHETVNNLLSNGSFEINGVPCLEGWQTTTVDSTNLVEDAPPNGGSWSLLLEEDSEPVFFSLLSEPLTEFQDGDVLRLSGFVRAVAVPGSGYISLSIGHGHDRYWSKYAETSETEWTFLSFYDTLSVAENDTIWVSLTAMPTTFSEDLVGALFDLISLEKLSE